MFTKPIVGAIILLVSSAQANDDGFDVTMTLRCFDYESAHALKEGFGELPFVQGNGDINMGNEKSAAIEMTLFVNPDTRSWTQMYKLGDRYNCVSAGGEGTFRPANIEPDGVKM